MGEGKGEEDTLAWLPEEGPTPLLCFALCLLVVRG